MAGHWPTHIPTSVYIYHSIILSEFCKRCDVLEEIYDSITIDTLLKVRVYMSTFLLRGNPVSFIKISLKTHCPIMVAVHVSGTLQTEGVCRCDVAKRKEKIHPSRCKSNAPCPVQVHANETGQVIENERRYDLL